MELFKVERSSKLVLRAKSRATCRLVRLVAEAGGTVAARRVIKNGG